uniref:Uncharacterized protein n=1 Tax=Lotharella globosa TaxID=91324 RepID=A0A7S3ZCB3_9EUKA
MKLLHSRAHGIQLLKVSFNPLSPHLCYRGQRSHFCPLGCKCEKKKNRKMLTQTRKPVSKKKTPHRGLTVEFLGVFRPSRQTAEDGSRARIVRKQGQASFLDV